MTKTQRQIQSEQTRQQIVETAANLFVRRGFHGTSIAHLTQETGLTKGALYHHFENKDALLFAVIQMVRDTWSDAVVRDVLEVRDALERIAILFDNHVRFIDKNDMACLVLSGLEMEMEDENPAFMTALQEMYAEMVEFIERIIAKGITRGQVRVDVDARLMAFTIVGMFKSAGCSRLLKRMSGDYVAVVMQFKQMILDHLHP